MKTKITIFLIACLAFSCGSSKVATTESKVSTEKKYNVLTVAFYNLENLFDTEDDTEKNDEASPIMEMQNDREQAYQSKLANMAKVISEIGADVAKNSPAIVGLCEMENRKVLEDLVNQPGLVEKNYGIAHYDSPDRRGIDVALLYQKDLFKLQSATNHELLIYDNNDPEKRVYTRDQLLVTGLLDGDEMNFIVNHWPSRSGGEARSRYKREKAAALNKSIIDSLQAVNPYAKIITMGDLNDDPTNTSVTQVLGAKDEKENLETKDLYNPMMDLFKQGIGTLAYRDGWNLFDQMIMSKPLLDEDFSSYRFYKVGIYNKNYLANPRGRYKGYPFRSWSDGGFTNGFSDHFPVYVYLIKEVN